MAEGAAWNKQVYSRLGDQIVPWTTALIGDVKETCNKLYTGACFCSTTVFILHHDSLDYPSYTE